MHGYHCADFDVTHKSQSLNKFLCVFPAPIPPPSFPDLDEKCRKYGQYFMYALKYNTASTGPIFAQLTMLTGIKYGT